jgi:hypothetical protein
LDRFKRFGVLSFCYRNPKINRPKLLPARVRGNFLGYASASNSYLIGYWKSEKDGSFSWDTLESESVRFTDFLVRDIQQLRPDSNCISVTVDELNELDSTLRDTERQDLEPEDDVFMCGEYGKSMVKIDLLAHEIAYLEESYFGSNLGSSFPLDLRDFGGVRDPSLEQGFNFSVCFEDKTHGNFEEGRESEILPKFGRNFDGNFFQPNLGKFSDGLPHPQNVRSLLPPPNRPVLLEPKRVTLKKRFRDGSEMEQPFSPSPPYKRVKCVDNPIMIGYVSDVDGDDCEGILEFLERENETLLETHVYLSHKEAMASETAPRWVEAISKEKAKLETMRTWREVKEGEIGKGDRVIPIALLLTLKRDGTHKCRAVVLGNQCSPSQEQLFAPVASWISLRSMVVTMAREGDAVQIFDLDNAFLNAEMPHDKPPVFVSLPQPWREPGDRPVRRLLRALYGLPQSPILWYKKYAEGLKRLGWVVSPFEPGIWRKASSLGGSWMKLLVYVDDNLIAGPCEREVSSEMKKVLALFPGRVIDPVRGGSLGEGWEEWDVLGATFSYNRSHHSFRLSMGAYIDGIYDKFYEEKLAPKISQTPLNPGLVDSLESEENPMPDFPYREVVGSIMWTSSTSRPDVARPINLMAKFNNRTPTKARVRALMGILAYMKRTRDYGISYSPGTELEFVDKYKGDGLNQPVKLSPFNLFCDASGYTPSDEGYSISGYTMSLYGVPVAWKSKRQTIRAHSTCEAEYIALSDGIGWAEVWGHLSFFIWKMKGRDRFMGGLPDGTLIWTDSMSARDVAISDMNRPASRWLALRWYAVKNHRDRLKFCVSADQRADCLTKPPTTVAIGAMLSRFGMCPIGSLA